MSQTGKRPKLAFLAAIWSFLGAQDYSADVLVPRNVGGKVITEHY